MSALLEDKQKMGFGIEGDMAVNADASTGLKPKFQKVQAQEWIISFK